MKPKTKDRNEESKVSVSKNALLSLVASRLNGRDLFPGKIKRAREFVRKLKQTNPETQDQNTKLA
ncbi:hypothetical protein JMG10_14570 [Nostoc ellipsosporum NOK]|nr:hypothetical protein [Nostoc ellipsosporum NOK]